MAKKGKKGKKGKKDKNTGPEPVTTPAIIEARTRMLCPRMGDVFNVSMKVENILEDVCNRVIEKAIEKEHDTVNLTALKLSQAPNFTLLADQMRGIVEINLAKNNLFNSDMVFSALSSLPHLLRLNLSNNFLNGNLSNHVAGLPLLESLNLDVNQLTSLPATISRLGNLQVFSVADNSLTSLPIECAAWASIRIVNIRNNKITEIINSIVSGWAQKLEKLMAGSNLLKSIPEDLGLCSALQELDFSK